MYTISTTHAFSLAMARWLVDGYGKHMCISSRSCACGGDGIVWVLYLPSCELYGIGANHLSILISIEIRITDLYEAYSYIFALFCKVTWLILPLYIVEVTLYTTTAYTRKNIFISSFKTIAVLLKRISLTEQNSIKR